MTAPATPAAAGLRGRVLKAGSWVLGGHAVTQLIRLASSIVLARLLAPDAFGLMAVVYVLMIGLALFSDMGINITVVQSPRGKEPAFLDTAWTLQALRGLVLGGATLLMAGGFALAGHLGAVQPPSVYADPRLPAVVAVFSLVAVLGGLESIRVGTTRRDMQQHLGIRIELLSQIISTTAMVALAWWTRSIWALVFGAVFSGALRCGLGHRWLPGHRERWRLEPEAVRELLSKAKWILLASILGFVAVNGDRLVLGTLVDSSVLGVYAIAFTLINTLQVVAGTLCGSVAYPALSEVARERPADLGKVLARFQWIYDGLICTAGAAVAVAGPAIVGLLYDSRYQAAGWMLSVLALGSIGLRYQLVEQCYQAVGRPKYQTLASFIRLACLMLGILLGHHLGGLQGAVVGIALSQFSSWPLALWFKARQAALGWRAEALLLPALVGGAGLGWVGTWLIGLLAAWRGHPLTH